MGNIKYVKKEKDGNLLNYILIVFILIVSVSIILMLISGKSNIKEINYQEYVERIKNPDYTVILLARDGCVHCQMYKPFVDELAKKYEFIVYYLNVDKLDDNEFYDIHDSVSALINEYSSSGEAIIPTPTTVIYKNGSEIVSEVGNLGEEGLEKILINNKVVK